MNAIVALCHFCEIHGPGAIFCTQTIRDTSGFGDNLGDESSFTSSSTTDEQRQNCAACTTLGKNLGFVSKDPESSIQFLSTQIPFISSNVIFLVKQAAVRSLSCDIYSKRDGGFIYFGDATGGHVLSHAFELADVHSRGSKKLFSIIILMKDKMFLLNTQTFLSDYLTKISKELQASANAVFKSEESLQSDRIKRMSSTPPRSLTQLTGNRNVFGHLHSHFCWLLWAGARYLVEHVTIGSPIAPPWLGKDTEEGFTLIHVDKEEWLLRKRFGTEEQSEFDNHELDLEILKEMRRFLLASREEFINMIYCALIGIQVILRGPTSQTRLYAKGLKKLLPDSFSHLIRFDSSKYLNDCRILCVYPETAVPQPSTKIFRIDFLAENKITVKWTGDLPHKLPDLIQKIIRAFDEKLFNNEVLDKQLKVLVHEWKNKIMCIKNIQSNQEMNKLKKILGIQPHDSILVQYWIQNL